MKTSLLMKKLHIEKKEFVTARELKGYCARYDPAVKYLLSRKYLVRIFRGIFYIKSLEEIKYGKEKYNHLELVSKGMELKGVKNWYFGLNSALKLNNITHEHFTTDYVINDRIFRAAPVKIAGHQFRFVKFSEPLFGFGVLAKEYKYSDIEKTILDFIYYWRYNNVPEKKILLDISEWLGFADVKKLAEMSGNYPKTVRRTIEKAVA